MLLIHSYKNDFEIFCFPIMVMYILNIVRAIKKKTIKELKEFIFENYHQRMGFARENSYCSMKHQEKKIYNCL